MHCNDQSAMWTIRHPQLGPELQDSMEVGPWLHPQFGIQISQLGSIAGRTRYTSCDMRRCCPFEMLACVRGLQGVGH